MRPLLERSTDAALVLRSDGVVTYASSAVRQLFGWSEEKIIGAAITSLLHPDDRPALGRFLEKGSDRTGCAPAGGAAGPPGAGLGVGGGALTNLLDDPTVRGVVCNLRVSLGRTSQERAETHAAQLETALQTRVIIEQAQGVPRPPVRDHPQAAFEVLRRYARSHHLAMQDVARRVVAAELPMTPPPNAATA